MTYDTSSVQRIVKILGFDPGPVDGVFGPKTTLAVRRFQVSRGICNTGIVGKETWAALMGVKSPRVADLPWMVQARSVFGLREDRDNAALRAFLRSDGATLGDPDALPWCGDFVVTCVTTGLPDERFIGPLKENPYWARNWAGFGIHCQPTYGAVLVFARTEGGHVGFAVGQDADEFYVLGGNQGDRVCITRIAKSRLVEGGCRWPLSFPHDHVPLPQMTATGIPQSVNEF